MARPDQRRKTQREEVDLRNQNPTQLNVTRRYLQAGGYDKNVRAARALERAFGVGVEAVAAHKQEQNEAGRRQALGERAAGQDRKEDEKNAAYHRAWDELDADYDFLQFESELNKEMLELGAGEWDEPQLQQFLSEKMAGQFEGIDKLSDSAYAQLLAPKLLELETKIITDHREQVFQKLQQEKRVKTYTVYKSDLEKARELDPNAQLNYEGLFDKTGKFFAGADKKVTFWESIYDIAYDLGDPSVITNVPEMLNGIPTGNNDPAFVAEQQSAIDRATNEALRRDKAAAAAQEAIDKESYRTLMLDASIAAIKGEDVSVFAPMLYANPFGKGEDMRSLESTRRSSIDENESRSWNPNTVAATWAGVFNGQVSVDALREMHFEGYFGRGPQSTQLAEDMMRAADTVRARLERDTDGTFSQWNSQIDRDFPKSGGGPIDMIDPMLGPVNAEAKRLYIEMTTQQGMSPREAYMKVREQFDPVVDRIQPGMGRSSQSSRAAALGITYSTQEVDSFLSNKMSVAEFVGPRSQEEVLTQIGNMNLPEDKLNELALKLTQ